MRAFEVLYLETYSEFNSNNCKHVFDKKKVFAPQICHASVRCCMGRNVIFNCHGLSYTIFRVRAFEVLYLGTDLNSIKSFVSMYLIRKKFLPRKFVMLVLDAVWVKK